MWLVEKSILIISLHLFAKKAQVNFISEKATYVLFI